MDQILLSIRQEYRGLDNSMLIYMKVIKIKKEVITHFSFIVRGAVSLGRIFGR